MGGGGGGWAAEARLYPLLGVFGLAMSPLSASCRSNTLRGPKKCLTTTRVNFRARPFIGSIVSVMTLHGRKNSL